MTIFAKKINFLIGQYLNRLDDEEIIELYNSFKNEMKERSLPLRGESKTEDK